MRKIILISAFVGLLLSACSDGKKGQDDTMTQSIDTVPMLIMQVQKCSKLYTSEFKVHKIVTHDDVIRLRGSLLQQTYNIKIPLGERKIAIPMDATLKAYIDFSGFSERESHDTHPNLLIRYLLNVWRNVRATGPYFLAGILLSALFQRYVPQQAMTAIFGGSEAWGVLMAATIGVPLYACGGGTIPLLKEWLWEGMSLGSAAAFMLTGPATKITNLGALKIVLGIRRFLLYIAYVMVFALLTGLTVNLIL